MPRATPENPLAPSPAHLGRIRARAEELWDSEGQPAGQFATYLERAAALDALQTDCPVLLPNPLVTPPRPTAQSTLIEQAALQENLGEFPALFTDQGDTMPTPESREIAREFRDGEH